ILLAGDEKDWAFDLISVRQRKLPLLVPVDDVPNGICQITGHRAGILFAIIVNQEIAVLLEPSLWWMVDERVHTIQHLAAGIDHLPCRAPRDDRAHKLRRKRGHEECDFSAIAKAN